MSTESLQRSSGQTNPSVASRFDGAAALGGPLRSVNEPLSKSLKRALPDPIIFKKPEVPAGKATTTNGALVPNGKGAVPTVPISRTVTVPLGNATATFGGNPKAVTSASVKVPLAKAGGTTISGVIGTNGNRSVVLGASVNTAVFNDGLKLNADFSTTSPNNGKLTAASTTSLGATAKVGGSEISPSVAIVNSQEAGKTATNYKLSGKIPLATGNNLDLGATLSQSRDDASKSSLILNAGLQSANNQFSIQYEKTGAGVQTIQGRVGFSF